MRRGPLGLGRASAVLPLADGTLAVVSNTRHDARGYDVRLEVHGSEDSVADALEAGGVAEACTLSLREHRPVGLDEVRSEEGRR